MNGQQRLEIELAALAEDYEVRYDAAERTILVENVALAAGWTPRVVTVEIRFSEHFPATAPRVLFPGLLRCHGVVPHPLLVSGQYLVRGQLGDPIVYYPQWRPEQSTLKTVVETVLADLAAYCDPETATNSAGCD